MSNIYHLNSDNNGISVQVKVGTIGNPSTVITRHRSGGSFEEIARSGKSAAGNIPKRQFGTAGELLGATMVVDTAILLDKVPKEQLDQAFANLVVRVFLFGGLDGEQFFDLSPHEKKQFMDKRLIVTTKAIKLLPQTF